MLQGGFLDATVLAEYLVCKGLPFRECHEVSGTLVRMAEDSNLRLCDLTLKQMQGVCKLIEQDVFKCLRITSYNVCYTKLLRP